MSVPDPYRLHLLPFVERWVRERTRVAVFGTGPHTDLLFERLPELARVKIVGYVHSRTPDARQRYRGWRIRPLAWAAAAADVVLCSSFVNEPAMMEAAEPLPCKVVRSHPWTGTTRAASDNDVIYRPTPLDAAIEWPSPPEGGLARFATSTRVLDTIIETRFPFVNPREAGLARCVVRYVQPGARVLELGSASPRMTALVAQCAAPGGWVVSETQALDMPSLRQLLRQTRPRLSLRDVPRWSAVPPSSPVAVTIVGRGRSLGFGGTTGKARDLLPDWVRSACDVVVLHAGSDRWTPEKTAWLLEPAASVVIATVHSHPGGGPGPALMEALGRGGYDWTVIATDTATRERGHGAGATLVAVPPPLRASSSRRTGPRRHRTVATGPGSRRTSR